jgi:hypothetical protein
MWSPRSRSCITTGPTSSMTIHCGPQVRPFWRPLSDSALRNINHRPSNICCWSEHCARCLRVSIQPNWSWTHSCCDLCRLPGGLPRSMHAPAVAQWGRTRTSMWPAGVHCAVPVGYPVRPALHLRCWSCWLHCSAVSGPLPMPAMTGIAARPVAWSQRICNGIWSAACAPFHSYTGPSLPTWPNCVLRHRTPVVQSLH